MKLKNRNYKDVFFKVLFFIALLSTALFILSLLKDFNVFFKISFGSMSALCFFLSGREFGKLEVETLITERIVKNLHHIIPANREELVSAEIKLQTYNGKITRIVLIKNSFKRARKPFSRETCQVLLGQEFFEL